MWPPLSNTDTEAARESIAVETPCASAVVAAPVCRCIALCHASPSESAAGEHSLEPVGGAHAEQPRQHGPAHVGLDHRHACAGVALDERQVGEQRRLAVAGVGAEEQDQARRALAVALEHVAELQRGVQAPQRLQQTLGRRRLAVGAHDRLADRGQRAEHRRPEGRLDARQRAQPPVEAAEQDGGGGGQQDAEHEAEDRVPFGRRRDEHAPWSCRS